MQECQVIGEKVNGSQKDQKSVRNRSDELSGYKIALWPGTDRHTTCCSELDCTDYVIVDSCLSGVSLKALS